MELKLTFFLLILFTVVLTATITYRIIMRLANYFTPQFPMMPDTFENDLFLRKERSSPALMFLLIGSTILIFILFTNQTDVKEDSTWSSQNQALNGSPSLFDENYVPKEWKEDYFNEKENAIIRDGEIEKRILYTIQFAANKNEFLAKENARLLQKAFEDHPTYIFYDQDKELTKVLIGNFKVKKKLTFY